MGWPQVLGDIVQAQTLKEGKGKGKAKAKKALPEHPLDVDYGKVRPPPAPEQPTCVTGLKSGGGTATGAWAITPHPLPPASRALCGTCAGGRYCAPPAAAGVERTIAACAAAALMAAWRLLQRRRHCASAAVALRTPPIVSAISTHEFSPCRSTSACSWSSSDSVQGAAAAGRPCGKGEGRPPIGTIADSVAGAAKGAAIVGKGPGGCISENCVAPLNLKSSLQKRQNTFTLSSFVLEGVAPVAFWAKTWR